MKVVSSSEMARIEHLAYQAGSSDSFFMQNAGSEVGRIALEYIEKHRLAKKILLLCGKGNNGGDGYVAGIYLLKHGCSVDALQVENREICSPLSQENQKLFLDQGGRIIDDHPQFTGYALLLDGLFGTGFHGSLKEPYSTLVKTVNQSKVPIIAIDIPSGLNGENGEVVGEAIKAVATIYLQFPKLGFFLQDAWNYVGKLLKAQFGLPQTFIDQSKQSMNMLIGKEANKLMPPIIRKRQKYQRGYVVGIAGSPGMAGAALLSSESALRAGAGIYRLFYPQGMEADLSSSAHEVIKQNYDPEKGPQQLLKELTRASAVFIGPGIGRSDATLNFLRELLPLIEKPAVIDGDALTLIATAQLPIPKNAILTPHEGELMRLLKMETAPKLDMDFLKTCQKYAEKQQVTLILKGGPSFIFHSGETIAVNPTGDPGMATAGSGDVLTGLLAALLAQGLKPYDAARLGVYLHGLAGEYAAADKTSYCMLASDIINHFPNAFEKISEGRSQ